MKEKLSNPLEIKPEIELLDAPGICVECKTLGKAYEFVIFLGTTPIYTGKKYCEVCIQKYMKDEQ